jgi:hypothetical protein
VIIPQKFSHRNSDSHSARAETVRRRLAVIAQCATIMRPSVLGWAILHQRWLELAPACAHSPELAAEWSRVDALLGGHAARPGQNVKGNVLEKTPAVGSFLQDWSAAETLDRPWPNRMPTSRLGGVQFPHPTDLPSGERALGGGHA